MFLGSTKRVFLRPDLPFLGQSGAGPVKFVAQRRDRSHAQPPLGGEHGEDPQFDRPEHDAMLMANEGLACCLGYSQQRQVSRMKRSA